MRYRLLVLVGTLAVVVTLAVVSAPVAAQAPSEAGSSASTYTQPRTAWGDPDLAGVWRGMERIDFERPRDETREFYTDAEVAEKVAMAEARNAQRLLGKQENRGFRNQANYNSVVGYIAEKAQYAKRTSASIDPPDGRLPMWTMEQVKHYEMREAVTADRGDSDWTVDRPTSERCIPILALPVLDNFGMGLRGTRVTSAAFKFSASAGTLDGGASGGGSGTGVRGPYRFVQSSGFMVILREQQGVGGGNAASRIIPLDGRPPIAQQFRHFTGSSHGHWEGNTLVVVTKNLVYPGPVITSYGPTYPGDGSTLTFTERFTRTGPDSMDFRYTVDDPGVYVQPYTVQHNMTLDNDYKISPVICHEGHDDMPSALAAGRFDELTAIDNANDARIPRKLRFEEVKAEVMKAEAMKKR